MQTSIVDTRALARDIKGWAVELGFQQAGIADPQLGADEARLLAWLDAGRHGEMDYMRRHGVKRSRAALLHPGTLRVISVRLDYLPRDAAPAMDVLQEPTLAYVSRYALGRDYHKLMRKRLQKLADQIEESMRPENSWRVLINEQGQLEWVAAGADGERRDFASPGHLHAWWRLTRRPGERVAILVWRAGAERRLELEILE